MEADASARVASLEDIQSVDSSHVSLLTPQRHASAFREIEDVEYTVPGTQTTLHFSFREDRPLHRRSIGGYLLLMQDEVQVHINASGDGWLLPEDDPYQRKWPGFYFISKSSPLPASEGEHHLTYGIMDNVLKGLFDIILHKWLVFNLSYGFGSRVDIPSWDDEDALLAPDTKHSTGDLDPAHKILSSTVLSRMIDQILPAPSSGPQHFASTIIPGRRHLRSDIQFLVESFPYDFTQASKDISILRKNEAPCSFFPSRTLLTNVRRAVLAP
ncbi:MAG: hypothetical protein ASARMPREDX12_007954 [Alectoria sarmentosa]|nr:MAG: hypothetical protein ASARMPREDX12_007954 [Alectoria sarmentosa]